MHLHVGHQVITASEFTDYTKENPAVQEEMRLQGEIEDQVTEILDEISDKLEPIQ
jgi:hypothetical protein